MSFDSEFDYTSVTEYLNGRISDLTIQKNEASNCLAIIANLSAQYTDLSNEENAYLTKKHQILTKNLGRLGNVINEIVIVESLPSDSKNIVYNFYQTYISPKPDAIDDKIHLMRQLVCNTDLMIPHMGNIINDGNITSSTGNYLADLLCMKYQPRQETSSFTQPLLTVYKS